MKNLHSFAKSLGFRYHIQHDRTARIHMLTRHVGDIDHIILARPHPPTRREIRDLATRFA